MKNLENRELNSEDTQVLPEDLEVEKTELPQDAEKSESKDVVSERFEEIQGVVAQQAEQIEAAATQRGYHGILSKLAEKGRFIAGATMISLSALLTGCGEKSGNSSPENNPRNFIEASDIVETEKGSFAVDMGGSDFNCYSVTPETFEKIRSIEGKYRSEFEAVRGKNVRAPLARIRMDLEKKAKREIARVVKHSPKISEDKVPEKIKKSQEKRKEERERQADLARGKRLVQGAQKEMEAIRAAKTPKAPEVKKTLKQEIDEEIDRDLEKAKHRKYRSIY